MTCPICKSVSRFKFTSNLNIPIYQCRSIKCRHLFVENYNKNHGICERSWDTDELIKNRLSSLDLYGERNKKIFKAIWEKLNLKENARVLDFGSGDGYAMLCLRQIYPKVEITCIEPNMNCKKLLSEVADTVVDSVDELSGKFDLIILLEVIEHLADPIKVLKSLGKKLLDNNAGIYITTPLGETHLLSNITHAYDAPSHLHFFTRNSLNLCLVKSGLTPLDVDNKLFPIYSTFAGQTTKSKFQFFVDSIIFYKFLKLAERSCILPSKQISGMCYRL
jgi:2-polyprenyl-3-methyl-5-hydroxy-6-metoxy-1,4-benzoquinol methylase